MKEKIAINILKTVFLPLIHKPITELFFRYDDERAINAAIDALKEVEQYRAIGTVRECREAMEEYKKKSGPFDI